MSSLRNPSFCRAAYDRPPDVITYSSFVSRWAAYRARCRAPAFVTGACALLLLVELIHTGIVLSSVHSEASPAAKAGASPIMGVDAQRIVSAHLFGTANPPIAPREERTASANLSLDGTIATHDPRHGMAIIGGELPTKVYSVGDAVGGTTLYSVFPDHVILDRSGAFETLRLLRAGGIGHLNGTKQASLAAERPAIYVDNRGRTVDKPPGRLEKLIRTVGSRDDRTGKMRGFLVYPVGSGAPLRILGLVPADLITEINGTPLDDPKRSQELLDQVQSAGAVSVTVERQNQKLSLVLNVEAAVAELPPDSPPLL